MTSACGAPLSPREAAADHGALNDAARHKINLEKITTHWEHMTRVAASLVTGAVHAYDLLRMFTRENGSPAPLGAALIEYGRIAKTLHLLSLIDPSDESYRRAINSQLTVQESRHRLARAIFHGRRGQIYQRYGEGQEDQLGALGLVLNAVVLWNTKYTDAAITALRENGKNLGRGHHEVIPAGRCPHQHVGRVRVQRTRASRTATISRRGRVRNLTHLGSPQKGKNRS